MAPRKQKNLPNVPAAPSIEALDEAILDWRAEVDIWKKSGSKATAMKEKVDELMAENKLEVYVVKDGTLQHKVKREKPTPPGPQLKYYKKVVADDDQGEDSPE